MPTSAVPVPTSLFPIRARQPSCPAAAYLQSIGFSKKAFLLGTEGMAEELAAAGIDCHTWEHACTSGSGAAALEERWTAEAFGSIKLDPSIGAVVCGWDPAFSYARLCYASALLRELPDVHFVVSNLDHADNMGEAERRGHALGPAS